jgi:hypothetical protein
VSLTNPVGGKRRCLVLLPRQCYRFLFQFLPLEWPMIFREAHDDPEMPGGPKSGELKNLVRDLLVQAEGSLSPITLKGRSHHDSVSGWDFFPGRQAPTPNLTKYFRFVPPYFQFRTSFCIYLLGGNVQHANPERT